MQQRITVVLIPLPNTKCARPGYLAPQPEGWCRLRRLRGHKRKWERGARLLVVAVGGAYMGALALPADEAEVFDWACAGGSEPVRGAGVEFCCFSCLQ